MSRVDTQTSGTKAKPILTGLSGQVSLGTGNRRAGVRMVPRDTVRLLAIEAAVFIATAGLAGLAIRGSFGNILAHPRALVVASSIAVLLGSTLGLLVTFDREFLERRFVAFVYLCNFGVPLLVTTAIYAIGPLWIGAVILYVEVTIFAFYLYVRPLAVASLIAVATQFGAVLLFQSGYRAPLIQWVALVGTLAIIGAIFGGFLDRADAIADSERSARSELADINSDLEVRVNEQVGELTRLSRLRRFLSPQVADAVLAGDGEGLLAPHRRQIAVFFCDLRGFTSFASTAEPEEVVDVLDAYYAAVGHGLRTYEATVGAFAGDGIMAYLNDPVPCSDPPRRAVDMALSLTTPMGELVTAWERKGFQLGYGVGIAYGYATLGTIGFEGRNDYTALGPVVNLASRLCGEAAHAELLIDQRTHDAVSDNVAAHKREVTLKGFPAPVTAFNVLGPRG